MEGAPLQTRSPFERRLASSLLGLEPGLLLREHVLDGRARQGGRDTAKFGGGQDHPLSELVFDQVVGVAGANGRALDGHG
eukprot:1345029-Heterocapsa_arctica.AAC.1